MRVAVPSTPANHFHLLRRQALSEKKKPLVVFTPKSLLRHRLCVSSIEEFTTGGFQPVLADPGINGRPLDADAVRRIHEMMVRHRWEVFFLTQRPATEGDTVQRQTQRWLVEQGFDLPSVLVIAGSRGAAAAALRLDYHVDDSAKNCIDVKSESGAKPLLIVDAADDVTAQSARRLGIGTATSIDECLTILEQASLARSQPNLLHRIAKLVGWH
jgi:hypothetical protein